MPGWIGPWEIAILLVVILLVFGPKRVPEFGRSIGKGIRELKSSLAMNDEDDGALVAVREDSPTSPRRDTAG